MHVLFKCSLKLAEELICLLPLLLDDIFLALTPRDESDREQLWPSENRVPPSAPDVQIRLPIATIDHFKRPDQLRHGHHGVILCHALASANPSPRAKGICLPSSRAGYFGSSIKSVGVYAFACLCASGIGFLGSAPETIGQEPGRNE